MVLHGGGEVSIPLPREEPLHPRPAPLIPRRSGGPVKGGKELPEAGLRPWA